MRVVLFPSLARRLRDTDYMQDTWGDTGSRDPFYFASHNHYLAKPLSLRQRVSCALYHYHYERDTFTESYRQSIYRGEGLSLWSREIDGNRFGLTLTVTDDNRYEGDLSVVLRVNGVLVCRMSYTVVDGALFGLAGEPVIFVTRNQVTRGPEHELFGKAFRQNSPPYFCLAAIVGVATALGMNRLAVIRSESQIAFEPQYEKGFKGSYCTFWAKFGAREGGPLGYILDIPLPLRELSEMNRKHRGRAQFRRLHWSQILESASAAIDGHRRRGPVSEYPFIGGGTLMEPADGTCTGITA
jgi:uncharacterized protein VirK/YbjX